MVGGGIYRSEVNTVRILFHCVALPLLSICCMSGAVSPSPEASTNYRHAYYLFIEGIQGCENCYVPLLITKEPIEQMAKSGKDEACVLIVTYERDSIWHDDGIVLITPKAIESPERIIHLRERKYRYQEISSFEALKLLQNPMGTIPISRPFLPTPDSPGPTLEELIAALQEAK